MRDWILIPEEVGGHIAIARQHIVRVELGPRKGAIGATTGELRLQLALVDKSVQTVRGSAIRDVLSQLDIEGLRPKPTTENEEAA
jgi:hypothetical protein